MLKNKIPLSAFIGANLFTLGIFFLGLGYYAVLEVNQHSSEPLIIGFILLICGGGLMFSGVGLMTRKNWARIVLNVLLVLLFGGLCLITYFFIQELLTRSSFSFRRQIIAQVGLLSFSFMITFGIFLYINNTRVIEELKKKKE